MRPLSNKALPKTSTCASAWSGCIAIASRHAAMASASCFLPLRAFPRLLYTHHGSWGLSARSPADTRRWLRRVAPCPSGRWRDCYAPRHDPLLTATFARRCAAIASSSCPLSRRTLPRLLYASNRLGLRTIALRYAAMASSSCPRLCRIFPRLRCASGNPGAECDGLPDQIHGGITSARLMGNHAHQMQAASTCPGTCGRICR